LENSAVDHRQVRSQRIGRLHGLGAWPWLPQPTWLGTRLFAALARPLDGNANQELTPALVGHGEEGGPVLSGKPGCFLGGLSAGSAFLIPGVGGELGGNFPCIHHIPHFLWG
jgi:hypothetical protein